MNELKVFEYGTQQVRTVSKDGEPWFVAKDVCDILNLGNSRDAVSRLDDDEKGVGKADTLGGTQELSIISESGLYALVMRSNKPEAKKFRKWITSEVLPTIRKTGAYATRPTKEDASLKRADAMLNNSRVRLAKFVRETVKDIWDYLSPEAKQQYSSYVVETATGQPGLIPLPTMERTYTATELGQIFGVTANKIGHVANEHGLKTDEYGVTVLDKSRYSDKQVTSFRYNEQGRRKLGELLGER